MISKEEEIKDFNELRDIIFKKLQDEKKQVIAFQTSSKFFRYMEEAQNYNKLYYLFNNVPFLCSDEDKKIRIYSYSAKKIDELMTKIATGVVTDINDVELLNKILNRQRSNLSFEGIFDIRKLRRKTKELQKQYDDLNFIKKFWLHLWY